MGGGPDGTGLSKTERYANPFYGIAQPWIPQTMDHMLWWANHFLIRFAFYRTALSRVANYFVTSLNIECDDSEAKDKYEEIYDDSLWKQTLAMIGLNLLAYGNVFLSINQGFERFLTCPHCHKISNIEKIDDYEFTKDCRYIYQCPSCGFKGAHEVVDKPSKDLKKMSVIFWNPREIIVRFDETSGASEYYWDIPQEYITKVTQKNNKFYSKKTPKAVYDCILQKKCLAFNNKNFIHLKVPTPVGLPNEGKAVPFCIYLWDEFWMLKVLERFNQAICMEDIVPFRVFSLTGDNNPQNNSILHQSATQWKSGIQAMIKEHRQDPGAYHTFPFPVNYQQLGGDAKNLVTPDLLQMHVSNLLNALNIPQELYNMQLQTQAIGPALRLFENSWSFIISIYNQFLNHYGDIAGKVSGLCKAKITIAPVTLSDDMERKSIIGQLVSANAIARSELLKLYGFDYREQVRKKLEEDDITKELTEEQQTKQQLQEMAEGSGEGGQPSGGSTPQDVLSNAQEIAQQLFPMDGGGRRQKLQEIKMSDATLYSAVKQQLEEMTQGAKSQGVQQGKQQAGQQQQK